MCRILQYGLMSQSSEASEGEQRVTKSHVEAPGDQGLLNLLTQDTVFYVGGYPSSFKVGILFSIVAFAASVIFLL